MLTLLNKDKPIDNLLEEAFSFDGSIIFFALFHVITGCYWLFGICVSSFSIVFTVNSVLVLQAKQFVIFWWISNYVFYTTM